MQGFTLPAALVDLQFDENTDPVTGYVALSRVRMADHLVIMQPFNIKTFQKGCNEINGMLLKKLRAPDCNGDITAEVEQYKNKHLKRRQCFKCEVWKDQNKDFSRNEKNNGARRGTYQCTECDAKHGVQGYKAYTPQAEKMEKCTREGCQTPVMQSTWEEWGRWKNKERTPLVCVSCKPLKVIGPDTLQCTGDCGRVLERTCFEKNDLRGRQRFPKCMECRETLRQKRGMKRSRTLP